MADPTSPGEDVYGAAELAFFEAEQEALGGQAAFRAAVDSAYAAGVAAGRAQAAADLQPLLESWYHDPDCQMGRRELGGETCAHFDKRWRHECAQAVMALLGGEPRG